jgi:PAS domain S-box-containing protein
MNFCCLLILWWGSTFLPTVQLTNLKTPYAKGRLRILHVDDDPSFLEVSKEILTEEGNFEVDDALSVDDALKKLVGQAYDMVVSDYEMPQKNGLDFLRELREQKNTMPFALFTGKGREEVAMMALNLGADGYYNKHGSTDTVYGELAHGIKQSVERKKAEQSLKDSEERFSAAFNLGGAAFCITEISTGLFVDCNEKFLDLLGYSKDEIVGRRSTEINLYADPNERGEIVQLLRQNQPVVNREVQGLTKFGKPVVTLFSAKIIEIKNQVHILTTLIDISERKKAEEELKESNQKIQRMNEKLHVVGSLTRHDVANKLSIIRNNMYLLQKHTVNNPELAKYFEAIDSAISSSNRMFKFSHFYEKIGIEELSTINVEECFNQAVTLMPNLGNIKVANESKGVSVVADSLLIHVFYNLIDNSLEHGGKVAQIGLHYIKEENGVKLVYEDDGVGVSEADKPKIFDEGFSTSKSTGLGLPLIRKTIEVYGWTIIEKGEPCKGAKFTITIPKINKNGKESFQIS